MSRAVKPRKWLRAEQAYNYCRHQKIRYNFSKNGALCTNYVVHKLDYTVAVSYRRRPTIRSKDTRVGEVSINWSKALDNFAEGIEITIRVN